MALKFFNTNSKRRAVKLVFILFFLFCAYFFYSKWENNFVLKNNLNLNELPDSVSAINCSSCALTDVIVVCTFKLNPKDSEQLLQTYPFKDDKSLIPYSHSGCGGVKPIFQATSAYEFIPEEFKHGGWIRLFFNEDKTLGLIDVYEE